MPQLTKYDTRWLRQERPPLTTDRHVAASNEWRFDVEPLLNRQSDGTIFAGKPNSRWMFEYKAPPSDTTAALVGRYDGDENGTRWTIRQVIDDLNAKQDTLNTSTSVLGTLALEYPRTGIEPDLGSVTAATVKFRDEMNALDWKSTFIQKLTKMESSNISNEQISYLDTLKSLMAAQAATLLIATDTKEQGASEYSKAERYEHEP